jgi:hypothetical protein
MTLKPKMTESSIKGGDSLRGAYFNSYTFLYVVHGNHQSPDIDEFV